MNTDSIEIQIKANVDEFVKNVEDAMSKYAKDLENAKKETEKRAKEMEGVFKVASLAISGAGIAIEGFTKNFAPLNESIRKTASTIDGMTEDAMRKLVIETSNVTFGIDEVVKVMEIARKQGITSAEDLKAYASTWDDVASASGESAVALADSATSLRAVGIEAGNEQEAMSAFGFIMTETTGTVGEFMNTINRLGPQIRDMGMDIDDTAAILGAMERELGMTSRVAMQEFRRAVNESDGDINKLKQSLGLTEEQIEKYRKKVDECTDTVGELARINEQSKTSFDRIKQKFSEVSLAISPYIESLSAVAPILMAVGPAVNFYIMAKGKLIAINTAVKVSLTGLIGMLKASYAALLAHPFGLIVIAIGAVITAIILLWKNWEKVVNLIGNALDWLEKKFSFLAKPIDWLRDKLKLTKDAAEELKDETEELATATDELTTATENYATSADTVTTALDGVATSTDELIGKNKSLEDSYADAAQSFQDYCDQCEKIRENFKKQEEEFERGYASRLQNVYDKIGIRLPELYERESTKLQEIRDEILHTIETSKLAAEEKIKAIQKTLEWYAKEDAALQGIKEKTEETAKKKSDMYMFYDAEGKPLRASDQLLLSKEEKEAGVTYKKFHTGGIFKAPVPGGEGLALLQDGETVLPRGGGISINIGAGAVQFVGTEINDATVRKAGNLLFDQINDEMRRRGLSFAENR